MILFGSLVAFVQDISGSFLRAHAFLACVS